MNILFCSVGRRCELLKDFRRTLGDKLKIVVTDNSTYAPALAFADVSYQVPLITDETYIPKILEICKKEQIDAITTLIDPEISILADHREQFEALGVTVLAPYKETADLCQYAAIDVNGDGSVNNRDASMLSRYLVGKEVI